MTKVASQPLCICRLGPLLLASSLIRQNVPCLRPPEWPVQPWALQGTESPTSLRWCHVWALMPVCLSLPPNSPVPAHGG